MDLGDHVPDLAFAATDGRIVHLTEFRGEAMVLVFMRHLG
jgi:peroxiredoxin